METECAVGRVRTARARQSERAYGERTGEATSTHPRPNEHLIPLHASHKTTALNPSHRRAYSRKHRRCGTPASCTRSDLHNNVERETPSWIDSSVTHHSIQPISIFTMADAREPSPRLEDPDADLNVDEVSARSLAPATWTAANDLPLQELKRMQDQLAAMEAEKNAVRAMASQCVRQRERGERGRRLWNWNSGMELN